ncbi:MAG TPA: outer membrane beta-barrel protein [Flavisolibacter sp.]|jgi:hypothetical protein|nr:outer membrane beta-barrel protein [Flavisolibacter sp.]
MLSRLLLCLLLSFTCLLAIGQGVAVSGKVVGEEGKPLAAATVTLHRSATDSFKTLTDSAGIFSITTPPRPYRLLITHAGYTEHSLENPSPETLRLIQLIPYSKALDAVVVKADQPLVEADAGSISYNVSKSMDAPGLTALEVLKKAPGVFVLNEGAVTLHGKGGVLILLDGKQTYLSGQELTDLLKSLPASHIRSIEIIANPTAKYDAAGSAGIINIKTAKTVLKGFSGSATAGIAYGISPKHNADFSASYRRNNLSLYGSYNHFVGYGNYVYGGSRQQNHRTYNSATDDTDKRSRGGARLGLDYSLDKKSTIGILLASNFVFGGGITRTQTDISRPGSTQLEQVLYADNDYYFQQTARYNLNLNYRYEDAAGRLLNVDADWGWFNKNNSNLQSNLYTDAQKVPLLQNQYRIFNGIDIPLKAVKLDYTVPLWKGVLETGAKFSSISSGNAADFYHVMPRGDSLDNRRSNSFSFGEDITAAYANYKKALGKWSVQGGLRMEQASSAGTLHFQKNGSDTSQVTKRAQLKLFPSFSVSVKPSANHNYSLSYSRRIDRPAYQDLNPFVYLLDELSFWQGNPFLQPQLTHRASVQWLYKSSTIIGLHFSHTADYSTRITDTIEQSKIVMIPRNLGEQQNWSLTLTQNLKLTKWWEASFNGTLYRLKNKVAFDAFRQLNLEQTAARLNLQQRFKLPAAMAAELSAYYNSRRLVGANEIVRATSQVDLAVQKNFLNNKATVRLAFNDMFKGTGTRSEQRFEGFYLSSYGYYETRQVRLNFTYKFADAAAKAPRNRSSALENENGRIRN